MVWHIVLFHFCFRNFLKMWKPFLENLMGQIWLMDHRLPTPYLENEEQIKFKARREEIINIRTWISEIENRKTIKKIVETKSLLKR